MQQNMLTISRLKGQTTHRYDNIMIPTLLIYYKVTKLWTVILIKIHMTPYLLQTFLPSNLLFTFNLHCSGGCSDLFISCFLHDPIQESESKKPRKMISSAQKKKEVIFVILKCISLKSALKKNNPMTDESCSLTSPVNLMTEQELI